MLLTAQALQLKLGDPTRKLILCKLADNANDDGVCFPSLQYIADLCEVSKPTVIKHINILCVMGLIEKHIRKNENGNDSNVYVLHLENGEKIQHTLVKNLNKGVVKNFNPPSKDFAGGVVKNFNPNQPYNQSINHTTLTSCINAHASEPTKISAPPKKKSSVAKNSALALLAEFGITGQLAEDFIAHRKAKKAPINETALKGFQREADKAGIPIQRAVEIAIERNWQGFKANWDWGDGFAKPNQNTAQHAKRGNPSAPIDWSGVVI